MNKDNNKDQNKVKKKNPFGDFPTESSQNIQAPESAPVATENKEWGAFKSSVFKKDEENVYKEKIANLEKEVRQLGEVNQGLLDKQSKLLALEEKREKEKEAEKHKKKPIEESLWWKKITAYASIITASGVLFHTVLAIIQFIKNLK